MGNYRYSQKIGRGGMAQVYLGLQEGIGGFEKPVVVKRIFPHLCENDHFVKMFLDEARLAATVRHPNVVEIFDIGHDAEGYFMVMEYLSGETLAFVAQTLSRQQAAVPPAIASRVGAAVAAGLSHAHQAVDVTGKPQPLVHRDVTPSNLMLCYNGAVKILDFGIAKAIESADESSDASSVKGKLSYLAPEQVRNQPLDARTDVFQLGIVMHEILCGRRLFNARTNHEKITAVMHREIARPSGINPDVPDYLDEIVLAALERDPARRIQSADELRRALEGALRRMGEPVSDADLGAWLRETFPKAHAERLEIERCAIAGARGSTITIAGVRNAAEPVPADKSGPVPSFMAESPTPSAHGQSVTLPGLEQESDLDAMLAMHARAAEEASDPDLDQPTMAIPHEEVQAATHTRDRRRARYGLAAALLGGLLATAGVLFLGLRDPGEPRPRAAESLVPPPPGSPADMGEAGRAPAEAPAAVRADAARTAGSTTYDIAVVAVPEHATIELDGRERSEGSMFRSLARDDTVHLLVISAPGYERLEIPFSADEPPPSVVRLHSHPGLGPAAKQADTQPVHERRPRASAGPGRSPEDPASTLSLPEPDARSESARTDNIDPWAQ